MNLNLAFYIIVGFIAQMIDGCLGMAYGVSSTSLLLSLGVSPGAASASVHASELLTTAVSGASHLKFGNVDKPLLKRLLIPGIVGGAIGAYILSELPGNTIKPFIAGYLMIMGRDHSLEGIQEDPGDRGENKNYSPWLMRRFL